MLDRTTAVKPSPESLTVFWLTKLFYEGTKKSGQLAEGRGIFFRQSCKCEWPLSLKCSEVQMQQW
jgi:hypothetical protein